MIEPPEPACLVIADISGYTSYLAGVELDHAQDILADLVGAVVGGLRPAFTLAKLEGDAAFAWAPARTIDGSSLQDAIEGTYVAFQRRLRDIRQASRCECNACALMPSLDLKVVVHHGLVARQRMAGLDELIGRDVILVHRLLKNEVEAATGLHAYALYTDACVEALDINAAAQGLVRHVERIDVIGEVGGWVRDLDAAWQAEQERARVLVAAEDAYRVFDFDMAAPRELVWEYITSPRLRPLWSPALLTVSETSQDGRRGAGTVNHCMHGDASIVEEILDWRPYDYWTTRSTIQMPGLPRATFSDVFFEAPGGSRGQMRIARPQPEERAAFEAVMPQLEQDIVESAGLLKTLVEAEAVRRAVLRDGEPGLPPVAGLSISQPVAGRR